MSTVDVHEPHEHRRHEHPAAWRDAHAAPGPASLLELGGDVGAVSIRLPADTRSGELTACPRGRPDRHFHTGVHLRTVGGRRVWVAVFPDVPAGRYSLLDDDGCEHTPFEVIGGQVTTLTV